MKHVKSLRQFIKEKLREKLKEFDGSTYIIVELEKSEFDNLNLLYEGNWKPSNEKDFWLRVDTPNFDHEKRHVHIAHKKHINTKTKQVSWNDDGSRHDKKTFDDNIAGMETAKRIARNVLKIPDDKILELYNDKERAGLILEETQFSEIQSHILIFKLSSENLLND